MRYLNLGCGVRFHPDWINIDLVAAAPGVREHDLRTGIPLEDGSCDVVYHSHVLEHIPAAEAPAFLGECLRVLKPGGTLRIAVPDLEGITAEYSAIVAELDRGESGRTADHEWILLEMYDQTVRERSGGRMLEYLAQDPLPNETFVLDRIGVEGRELLAAHRRQSTPEAPPRPSLPRRLARRVRRLPGRLRRRAAEALLTGEEVAALKAGEFRRGGEVHQWMYDRFSLARLLEQVGFTDPVVHGPATSAIPRWSAFNLDTLADGTVVKPDSLFMEAGKGR